MNIKKPLAKRKATPITVNVTLATWDKLDQLAGVLSNSKANIVSDMIDRQFKEVMKK